MFKKFSLFILLLLVVGGVSAQSQSGNYRIVYLWDVTYSMHGGYFAPAANKGTVEIAGKKHTIDGYNKAHDIYDKILDALVADIRNQGANAEIVVVPFGQKVLGCWTAQGSDEGKAELIDKIKNFCNLKGSDVQGTSISGALDYVRDNIFVADMPNLLKLLTDGGENYNVNRFYYLLDNWCEYSHERNISSYYFILSEEVLKKDPNLGDRLRGKSCFSVIDGTLDVDVEQLLKVEDETYINIYPSTMNFSVITDMSKPITLQVSMQSTNANQQVPVHFQIEENPYFELSENHTIAMGRQDVALKLVPKMSMTELRTNLPIEQRVKLTIHASLLNEDPNCELQTSECELTIINEQLKKITISVQ